MSISVESANIFRRMVKPWERGMSVELARFIKSVDFSEADQERFTLLSQKAQRGELTPEESDEIDAFLHVDRLISILHLKADQSLAGSKE